MAKILTIVRHDLLVFLSQRSNLPGLLITPIIMTVLIGLVNGGAFGGASATRLLDVINQDGSQASLQFLDTVRNANPNLVLCPMDNNQDNICGLVATNSLTESQALDRVANTTSIALLVIPANFSESLTAQTPVTITIHSTDSFGAAQFAVQAIQAALSQVNGAAVASQVGLAVIDRLEEQPLTDQQVLQIKNELYQRSLDLEKSKMVSIDYSLSGSAQSPTMGESLQQGLGQSVPGMGSMFVMMTIFGGMAALIVERHQWTLQRLAVMPLSRHVLLAGKILARFCLGLLQFTVVFVVGAFLGMNFGEDPLALLLLVIVYTLSITAISFAIGSGLKNATQASGLSLLLTLTLAPLGGAWWPLQITPGFMQIIGHISPVAWAMDGFTALTYNGGHLADILIPITVLLGMTLVAFLIAIPRFRYQVD